MLKPTAAELEEADQLKINTEGLNGPQLREKIRAKKLNPKPRVSVFLEQMASELGIEILPSDSSVSLRKRITKFVESHLADKNIKTETVVRFRDTHAAHAGKIGTIRSLKIIGTTITL